jgi:hypothetical protein
MNTDQMEVQPLCSEFKHCGYNYRQIKREGNVAIYSQAKGGVVLAYEVIVIRNRPARTWPNGKTTPEHEAYPGNEEWGRFGWTCVTLDRALERFECMVWERAPGAPALTYTAVV